jgi:hypothetical protein
MPDITFFIDTFNNLFHFFEIKRSLHAGAATIMTATTTKTSKTATTATSSTLLIMTCTVYSYSRCLKSLQVTMIKHHFFAFICYLFYNCKETNVFLTSQKRF